MRKTCGQYTFEDINRFIDNDLPVDQTAQIEDHCRSCKLCSQLVKDIGSISKTFEAHVEQQIQGLHPDSIKDKPDPLLTPLPKALCKNAFGSFAKNNYLKLCGITAILLIGLALFNGKILGPSGPSAIVNYVDTELPTVMIIETQKQKHTIIWFSET